ncbi:hypothetical protein [Rhizobium sp. 2MFCol3.1]|uniref:hypothetical protein n=1 Tax=Rhizobium sp. 2MFCol3.1 TaxID=1246459 RepID=UPI00035F9FD2|nr:hypothetical protein [Rhizobium sp. 2MFCol3.1]
MRITILASMTALSLAVCAVPLAVAGFACTAMAKDGNGGGNGGGHGGGGGYGGASHGNSGGQAGSSAHGTSPSRGSIAKGKSREASDHPRGSKAERATSLTTKERKASAELAGLNSLNRNYKAYLHTSDPRMKAISAYAVAYAQYELDNGIEPSENDPILGDQALQDALALATTTGGSVALQRAKSILGVGEAEGKIDQIRATLTPTSAVEDAVPVVCRPN